MNLKEVEKVVAGIQTQLFKNSNSYAIGMLKSHFKGTGLQFKEHQVYVHGDDVRFIDWKLSAKTSKSYIKTFEEERNIEIVVIIDMTLSMLTGYKGISKLQASIELACLLYLLANETNDKVKVIIWADREYILPAKAGKEGIVTLISKLESIGFLRRGKINYEYDAKDEISPNKKISIIKMFLARNKEVILLSDFSSFTDFTELNKTLIRKNMHGFRIQSPLDEQNQWPFSIIGFDSTDKFKKGMFVNKNTNFIEKRSENRIKGRVRNLNVKDRYLELFVKQML